MHVILRVPRGATPEVFWEIQNRGDLLEDFGIQVALLVEGDSPEADLLASVILPGARFLQNGMVRVGDFVADLGQFAVMATKEDVRSGRLRTRPT